MAKAKDDTASEKPDVDQTDDVQSSGPAAATAEPPAEGGTMPELTLGGGAPADETYRDPDYKPVIRGRIDRFGVAMGTGRRKTSVARVRVQPGSGKLQINERPLEDFFCIERDRLMIEGPLKATDMQGKVDVWVRVEGGGTTGQAGAVVLGIARALQALNPDLHHTLSDGGFLTRDSRMVERKKYGLKKARRSFQFSKR
jgi:small subunit ribosomal protein S9